MVSAELAPSRGGPGDPMVRAAKAYNGHARIHNRGGLRIDVDVVLNSSAAASPSSCTKRNGIAMPGLLVVVVVQREPSPMRCFFPQEVHVCIQLACQMDLRGCLRLAHFLVELNFRSQLQLLFL